MSGHQVDKMRWSLSKKQQLQVLREMEALDELLPKAIRATALGFPEAARELAVQTRATARRLVALVELGAEEEERVNAPPRMRKLMAVAQAAELNAAVILGEKDPQELVRHISAATPEQTRIVSGGGGGTPRKH